MDASHQDIVVQATACAIAGGASASASGLRRRVPAWQMFVGMLFASIFSGMAPFVVVSLWPATNWLISIPISVLIGVFIFGILMAIEKTELSVGNMDFSKLIPWVNKAKADPPQNNKEQPK